MRAIAVQSRSFRTRVNAEAQLQAIKQARLNTVIYNVHEGGAHYNSAFYARCASIEAGFDPLGYLVTRGRELGLHIYAWLCPGAEVWPFNSAWNMAGKYNYPANRNWTDFSNPSARQRVADIAADIVSKYPVDGITLDYIRYPAASGTYDPKVSLLPSHITDTVSRVRAVTKWRKLNAFVFYASWLDVLQDWPGWTTNGLIDASLSMMQAYPGTVMGDHLIRSWLTRFTIPTRLTPAQAFPCLYFIDYKTNPPNETIKTPATIRIEIEDALALNYPHLCFFDSQPQHLTQPMIDMLTQEFEMSIVTDLNSIATVIETQATAVTAKANEILAEAAILQAQAITIREIAAQVGQADQLADQLAEIL